MFKKLFTITYNNKKFLVLVDKYHRKTFLEVTNDGTYVYPTYEDYLALYHIYNNRNYDILCSRKTSKQISYKEVVRYKAGVLVVAVGVYGFCLGSAIRADIKEKTLNISYTQEVREISRDSASLARIYGYDWITRDDVVEVINNNTNLNDHYKQIAIETMDNLLALDHNVNLRIYYENMKDVRITELTYDELVDKIGVSAAGCYFRQSNEIYLAKEYLEDYGITAHEFIHAAFSLSDVIDNQRIVIGDDFGFSLNEAMTQIIVRNKWGNNGSYKFQQLVLDFLLKNMPDFEYHTYNEDSIIGVINGLKEVYPEVDIDYIVDFVDTLTTSQQNFEDVQNICEVPSFCDELFKIAIKNIDDSAVYQSFNNFMAIFKDDMNTQFYNKYFALYNQELVNQHLISQEMYNQLEKINSVCLINNSFYLGNNSYYFDYNGNCINNDKIEITLPINEYGKTKLLQDIVLGNNIFDSDYIHSLLIDENLLDYACIRYIRTLDANTKKALIDGIFDFMVNYIDRDNLYEEFNAFALFLTADYELYSEYANYLAKYDLIVSELCSLDTNMVSDIRNINCLVRHGDTIYPCINSYTTSKCDFTIWRDANEAATEYTKVHFGINPVYFYIANTGVYNSITFDEKAIDYFLISQSGVNRIIQYIVDNKIDNIWQANEFNKMVNTFGIDNNERKLTFEDNIINKDNYYVAFGLNGDGVGIILYDKDNNYIYGTCGSLKGNICYLPLSTFAKLGDGTTTNWENIEWIISNEYLRSIPNLALEYLVPNINVTIEDTISHDSVGHTSYGSNKIISYNNYGSIVVNGIKDYARHIYMYTDQDNNLLIHFFDEDKILGNLCDENSELNIPLDSYFTFFDDCLAYYNMLYEDSFTKEQVVEIFKKYANEIHLEAKHVF